MNTILYQDKVINIDVLVSRVSHINSHQENVNVDDIDLSICTSSKDKFIAIKRDGVYVLLTGDATTLTGKENVTLAVITKHVLKTCEVSDKPVVDYNSRSQTGYRDNARGHTRLQGGYRDNTKVYPKRRVSA